MIILELPWPPSLNHLYGVQKNGRRFIKQAGVEFKSRVCELVAEQKIKTLTGRVSVFIEAHMPDRRRRDLMNLEKIVSDSLTAAGVWNDDEQIDDFRIVRSGIIKSGKLIVLIQEIAA